jgi:hypothetical protein
VTKTGDKTRRVLVAILGAELLCLLLIAGGIAIGHLREESTATPPLATDFQWALDEGSERILYLVGGTTGGGQASAIEIRDASGTVLVNGETRALDPAVNAGLCPGARAQWPIWWSRTIPEPVAEALRRHDYRTYVFQALIDGTWQRLRLMDTGCRHRGQA